MGSKRQKWFSKRNIKVQSAVHRVEVECYIEKAEENDEDVQIVPEA